MSLLAINDSRTSSTYDPSIRSGYGSVFHPYQNDLPTVLRGKRYEIWLPDVGQTSPVSQYIVSAPSVETPLETVRKRVCADAFHSIQDLRSKDTLTTLGQLRLAYSLLISLQNRILDAPSSYTQFSTVHLGVMEDGEIVLEWFYDKGRIQFFIDADTDDSMAVFLDVRDNGPLPHIENIPITASDIDNVTARAVELAMELA